MGDVAAEVLVDLGLVDIIRVAEPDVGESLLSARLEDACPDLALGLIALDHLDHPVVGDAYGVEDILQLVTYVLDGKELLDVGMVNV